MENNESCQKTPWEQGHSGRVVIARERQGNSDGMWILKARLRQDLGLRFVLQENKHIAEVA